MKGQIKHNLKGECLAEHLAAANNEQLIKYGATLQCLNCGANNGYKEAQE